MHELNVLDKRTQHSQDGRNEKERLIDLVNHLMLLCLEALLFKQRGHDVEKHHKRKGVCDGMA